MSSASGKEGRVEGEEVQENCRVFTLLRSLCQQLLQNPTGSPASVLDTLASQLRDVSSSPLQACIEYMLFPLLLLLDTAVATRSSSSCGDVSHGNTARLPMAITDRMVEGVVLCLEVLLQRCFLLNYYQMVTILKSLTAAAMLSPSEASEEIRQGVVRCLKALFQSLKSCGDASCICSLASSSPLCEDDSTFYAEHVWRCTDVYHGRDCQIIESCHLASLQLEEMRVAIGHLFSVLLKISEVEANLGAVGSSNLRVDALSTLRVAVWKVGSADALSFFLPGIVSSLSKGIQNSKARTRDSPLFKWPSAPSFTLGAGGSPHALVESVKCMGDIIALVLGDVRNTAALKNGILLETKKQSKGISFSADEAVERLRTVSLSLKNRSELQSEQGADSSDLLTTLGMEVSQKLPASEIASLNAVKNHQGEPDVAYFYVERDSNWLQSTAIHINSILVHLLPSLCVHPTPAIRLAVVDLAALLLGACALTLQNCTELLLECLLSLASDEWKQVALAACSYLAALVSSSSDSGHRLMEVKPRVDISGVLEETRSKLQRERLLDIMNRLILRLPRAMYSANDDGVADLHSRKLAATMYFAGADAVSMLLLNSPVSITQFIQVMSQGFSFTAAFSGSMSYLATRSLELRSRAAGNQVFYQKVMNSTTPGLPVCAVDQLPHSPPWLKDCGGERGYKDISCILRLTGLAAVKSQKNGAALTRLLEPLLIVLRQVADKSGSKRSVVCNMGKISAKLNTGYHVREAAAAAAVINEILYGASGAWTDKLVNLFERPVFISSPSQGIASLDSSEDIESSSVFQYHFQEWTTVDRSIGSKSIINCVGNILHEFMEIWDVLSVNIVMSGEVVDPSFSFLQDILVLEQVLVEGVGVFALSVGELFDESGFLGMVLYPLLERLGSTYYNVSHAADVVLHTICSQCGYSSVTALVKANADHIVDSLCRQLRHLSMNPNAPRLLAGILQHTGAARDLLPLLHEPMRSIQIELEIPARQQHPEYIIPLLLGLREISKAVQEESTLAVTKARNDADLVGTVFSFVTEEKKDRENEKVYNLVTKLKERERTSPSIASLAGSCIVTCVPLLSAKEHRVCLLALDIVEHSIGCLADFEALDALDKSTKLLIRDHEDKRASSLSEDRPVDKDEFGNSVRRLLPIMNHLWPHLVLCLQHSKYSVVIRALTVIAQATDLGGGEFFARRMKEDALPLLVKLLHNQRFSGTGGLVLQRSSETLLLQQRQRGDPFGKEFYSSPAEVLKVQEAVMDCVSLIARRSKSATALVGLVGSLASWILGLGCAVTRLQGVASEALLALSRIDGDLVWMLVTDLAFGAVGAAPCNSSLELPPLCEIFPPLQALDGALWLQYTAQREDLLNVDRTVARRLLSNFNNPGKER